mmetsp:Transcript_69174/g.193369  ORF Transcript_69174/g.193369 Transcript_69174/m.193369 type:complete len:429 (+) Transcript_69174:314-1600(+)
MEFRVRVSHASLYCVEHEPFVFVGTSLIAPVAIDWMNPSKSKHEPSWSNIFHGSNVGDPVANAFKHQESSMLAFSDSFGLNGLIEDWLNRDRTNHGLVMYATGTGVSATSNSWSCRLAVSYAPDGRDDCVDTAVITLTTGAPNATEDGGTPGPVQFSLTGSSASRTARQASTETRLPGDFTSSLSMTSSPVIIGCGLGEDLESILLRIETDDALHLSSLTVERHGSRWDASLPDTGLWMSADPREGALSAELPLALVAAGLKSATVMIATAECPYPWVISGSLYVTLVGAGVGRGEVESEEQLFASRLECNSLSTRIIGVDRQLGPITAIMLRLVTSPSQKTPPLYLASAAVSASGVEYSSAIPDHLEVDNVAVISLAKTSPCITSAWITVEVSPFSCEGTGVAIVGSLVGSKGSSQSRVLTSRYRVC